MCGTINWQTWHISGHSSSGYGRRGHPGCLGNLAHSGPVKPQDPVWPRMNTPGGRRPKGSKRWSSLQSWPPRGKPSGTPQTGCPDPTTAQGRSLREHDSQILVAPEATGWSDMARGGDPPGRTGFARVRQGCPSYVASCPVQLVPNRSLSGTFAYFLNWF